MFKNKKLRKNKGITLIEVVMATSLFAITVVAIWTIFIFDNARIRFLRARSIGVNVATAQLELYRNMPYQLLGTVLGHPNGNILDDQTITQSGMDFDVQTRIRYFDNIEDGSVGGTYVGKNVEFWPSDCSFDPQTATEFMIDFYTAGVTHTLLFSDYLNGNVFNWSGSVDVYGSAQHFHIKTNDSTGPCPKIAIQTQNVDEPFKLYIDSDLIASYSVPDTFTPAPNWMFNIIGSGGAVVSDVYPNDYLQVSVIVEWGGNPSLGPIEYTTYIAQRGQETSVDSGILSFEILDASGNPVPNADITINNSNLSLATIIESSDVKGKRIVPVLPPDVEGYEISVTKPGYSTDQTYSSIAGNTHPFPPNLTVINGSVSEATFVIDLLSQIDLEAVLLDDSPANGVDFTIRGNKVISSSGPSVYKYPETTYTFDSAGLYSLSDMEFDQYTITANFPSGDVTETLDLDPNSHELQFLSPHTLDIEVRDSVTNNRVEDAVVTLSNTTISHVLNRTTDSFGDVHFTSLRSGDYDVVITRVDYADYTDTITIVPGTNSANYLIVYAP